MPKHVEVVSIYDPKVRTARAFTVEVTGPQLVIDALEEGCVNMEILANAVAGVTDRKCTLEVRVVQKDRSEKAKRL
jgi:hypothetical protein